MAGAGEIPTKRFAYTWKMAQELLLRLLLPLMMTVPNRSHAIDQLNDVHF